MSRHKRTQAFTGVPILDINDPETLRELHKAWYPGGSGPLGAMRTITGLVEAIAKEKGIDLEQSRTER